MRPSKSIDIVRSYHPLVKAAGNKPAQFRFVRRVI
jgi:hypothetical protein